MGDYTFYIRLTHEDVAIAIEEYMSSKYPNFQIAPAKEWETEENSGEQHTIPVLLPATLVRKQP